MIRFKGKFRSDDFGPTNSPFTPFREKYSHKNQNSNFKLLFNACHQVPFHKNLINRFYVKFKLLILNYTVPSKKKKEKEKKNEKTVLQMDGQTDKLAGRQAEMQTDRRTNRQTHGQKLNSMDHLIEAGVQNTCFLRI